MSLGVPGCPWVSLGCKVNNAYYNSYPPPQPKSVGNNFLDISKAFLRLRPWAFLGVPRLQRIMQNIMQYTIIQTPPAKKCWKSFFSHFKGISKAASLGVPGCPWASLCPCVFTQSACRGGTQGHDTPSNIKASV